MIKNGTIKVTLQVPYKLKDSVLNGAIDEATNRFKKTIEDAALNAMMKR